MSKGSNQKIKLYYLARIMREKTDDEHALTLAEIKDHLEAYDVTADRKCLYADLESLRILGLDVIGERYGREYYYHVGSKQFDIAELKLLVDAIQSSKFITERKSRELIRKLTEFASEHEALQMKRQVVVQGRIKTMNESIYYIVDDIHNAISNNKRISFEYMQWNLQKEMEPRREKRYDVSPWALTWDDENYYLVAYDAEAGKIKHYRVDKIRNIEVLRERREGRELFRDFDMAAYSRINFGMFGGDTEKVRIRFRNELVGVFIDRFGKDIQIANTKTDGWSETTVEVAVSDQFFGWIFALGTGVEIMGPGSVADRYRKELTALNEMYKA